MSYTLESAEVIALQALGWLAAHEDLFDVFQGASGASRDDIREAASDPSSLGAVLDFIMMDDAWVVQCCDSLGLGYERLMQARQVLPGGAQVNWT